VLPLALLSGLYALAGFALLPFLLEQKLPPLVQERTGAKLTLGAVRFNPFRFTLEADNVRLLDADDLPLFGLEALHADADLGDSFAARRPVIREIRLTAPDVHWQRLADGGGNFSRLFEHPEETRQESALPPPRIDWLVLERGALEFVDEARHKTIALREMVIEARNLLPEAGASAPFAFKAVSGEGETLALNGTLQREPWTLNGEARLDQVRLPFWWGWFGGVDGLALADGGLALEAPFLWRAGESADWRLGPGRLRLSGVKLNETATQTPLLEAAELTADSLSVDGAARRIAVERVTARAVHATGRRTAEGFNFQRRSSAQTPADAGPAPSSWSYRIASVRVEDSALLFEDRTVPEPVRVELSSLQFQAGALDSAAAAPIPVELSSVFNREGRVNLKGALTPQPFTAQLKIEAADIGLPPFQPWLERWLRLEVEDGALSINGELDYRQEKGAPQGRFQGEAGITGLRAVEADEEKELLAWKDLSLDGITLAFPAGGLRVVEVKVERPYARVIVNADKTLNWSRIVNPSGAKESGKDKTAFPVDIGAIRIHEGLADFADLTLKPNFITAIQNLNGAVKDLSSAPSTRARVLLEGQVERYSPVRIQGLVNPFRAGAYTDIEMQFHNVDLTRLSPYSGKFAGYRIEKGKMSLDLLYRLQNRQLSADNQIVLDHLTLGEQVESKDATTLPLRLAVALLKDSDGHIDIDLPIHGNLDDPQFSLAGLYGKAIVQLVTKLVASPFTVFGNLLEGSPEEYGRIPFNPGKATLAKSQKEKLLKLAEALKSRSHLNLEIKGVVHAGHDRLVLAELRLDKTIRQAWRAEQRAQGKTPSKSSKLVVPEDDAKRILTQLFRAATGENGAPPDPHPSDAFLTHARRVLVDKTEINEADLRLLAQKRSEVVRSFLAQDGGLPEQRIFLLDVQVVSQPDKDAQTLLMLNGS
jgi:hypothetical protein